MRAARWHNDKPAYAFTAYVRFSTVSRHAPAQALLIFAASLTVARLFDTASPERAGILLGIVACAGNLATSYLVHGWIVKDIARAMVREDREVFRRAREASAEAQADQVIAAARANAIVGSVRSASPKRLG